MSYSISDRNSCFVNFCQACLGVISRNVRRVDFAMYDKDQFTFRFVLRFDSSQDRESIVEVTEDFEAMHESRVANINTEIIVSDDYDIHPDIGSGYLGVYCERAETRGQLSNINPQ